MRHHKGTPAGRTPALTALTARTALAPLAMALALAGCAGKGPQGYGATSSQQETAAQAQQQLQNAQQATQVDNAQTYLDLITQMQQAGQWYASLAHTEAFAQCQVKKAFRTVCLREPQDLSDVTALQNITDNFKAGGYRMKQVFADTATYCMGD